MLPRRFTSSNVCLHTLFIVVLIVNVGDCDDDSVNELCMIFPRNVRFGMGGGGTAGACVVVGVVVFDVAAAATAAVAVVDFVAEVKVSVVSPPIDCRCVVDD